MKKRYTFSIQIEEEDKKKIDEYFKKNREIKKEYLLGKLLTEAINEQYKKIQENR